MTTMDRIAAHKGRGVLYSYRQEPYSDREVCVISIIDVSGKGRFQRIAIFAQTFPLAMADLADRCDALPGAGRGRKGLAA